MVTYLLSFPAKLLRQSHSRSLAMRLNPDIFSARFPATLHARQHTRPSSGVPPVFAAHLTRIGRRPDTGTERHTPLSGRSSRARRDQLLLWWK